MIALFGSIAPLMVGMLLARALGLDWAASFAVGAVLAPTSMGIALNVLRSGKVLNFLTSTSD